MSDLHMQHLPSSSPLRSLTPSRSYPGSSSPLHSLTPSRSYPGLSVSRHHSCLNYLSDPSMKRYMERICGSDEAQKGPPYATFTRAYSAPLTADLRKFSSSVPSFSSNFMRVSSPDVLTIPYADMPTERFAEGEVVPEVRDKHSESYPRTPKVSRVSFADTGEGMEHPRQLPRRDSDNGESMVLAAVDMGTNSFHIVVAKADSHGEFQVLDSEKEYVRLGSGSTLSLITPEAEARALETMKRFKMLASAYNAPLRVVATSAVREAGNRGSFLSNMLERLGVEIEVLSGREEACHIYRGVLQALPVYDKLVLTIDIGGGSTEIVIGMAGRPIYAVSLKLGHVRLTDLFIGCGNEPISKCQLDDVRKHVPWVLKELGVAENVRNAGFELAIGTSGTIETIEQIVNQGYDGDCATLLINEQSHLGLCGFREREFTRNELSVVVQKLCKAKNNDQRAKVFGLSPKRAEVVVAGAVLLEEIFLALDIHKMRVSPYALREGVIVDTLSKTYKSYEFSPNDILAGLRMNTTSAGLDYVSEVISLLDESDMELLEAAVTLHAIGMSIGFRDYHKHSHYLIKNNDILVGYSPMEIKMMSLLAKYHRKKVPSKKDQEFAQLPTQVQMKTRVLSAIIRIAVALNRCHCTAVKTVHVIRESDACVLVIVPSVNPATKKMHDVSLELWAAQDKLDFFEKVFKWKASIVIADHTDENSLKVDDLSDQSS